MQLLFLFSRGTTVEKTFMQTLACQLSSTLMQLLFSFDRVTRVEKTRMQTLLRNSHQLSCNSCSRLTGSRELRKLSTVSCKLSLLNSHAIMLVPVWSGNESWENSMHALSLLNSYQLDKQIYDHFPEETLFRKSKFIRSSSHDPIVLMVSLWIITESKLIGVSFMSICINQQFIQNI